MNGGGNHITFEYKVIAVAEHFATLESLLNRYGVEGFSVVTSIPGYLILQRTVRI